MTLRQRFALALQARARARYIYTTYACRFITAYFPRDNRAKEQIFYFYLIFDRRHVYLLGNTKNQRNNYKLTDSFEIEPICLFSILCTEL